MLPRIAWLFFLQKKRPPTPSKGSMAMLGCRRYLFRLSVKKSNDIIKELKNKRELLAKKIDQ